MPSSPSVFELFLKLSSETPFFISARWTLPRPEAAIVVGPETNNAHVIVTILAQYTRFAIIWNQFLTVEDTDSIADQNNNLIKNVFLTGEVALVCDIDVKPIHHSIVDRIRI